jgi:hypothetical protein
MNPKLFGAIVVVGAALAGCRSGILPTPDLADAGAADASVVPDAAVAMDLAKSDLPICCTDLVQPGADLAACTPVMCILIV